MRFAPMKVTPPGRFRRVPPAIFPPVLGLLGLALAWHAAGFAPEVAGLLSGAAIALAAFAAFAYGAKILRRPVVLAEDLAILPGRAGLGAAVLTVPLAAVLVGIHAPDAGRALLVAGMLLHAAFWVVLIRVLLGGPPEQRRVTPVWHLHFTGLIVHARAAVALDLPVLAQALTVPAVVIALAVYAVSIRQLATERVPAPLRPLLAIHLAPVALFGTVALGLGYGMAVVLLAWLALAMVVAGLIGSRWLLASGPSAMWGAIAFPLAATAALWQLIGPAPLSLAMLALATLAVPPITFMVWRNWVRGRLAVKTNAAIA